MVRERLGQMLQEGIIRRIGAVPNHYKLGYTANGMSVWDVDDAQVDRLGEAGVDIPKLARDGVTIFFTQVFRDGFFHADMHPGNIFVEAGPPDAAGVRAGRYVALDFGIMGTLNEADKNYLAQNFLAFLNRLIDRSYKLESLLRVLIHLAIENHFESFDGFFDRHQYTFESGKGFSYMERLREETLHTTGAVYDHFVVVR